MGKGVNFTGVVGVAIAAAGLVFGSDIHDHFFPPKENDDVRTVVTQLNQSLDEAAKGRLVMGAVNRAVNNCHEGTNPWRQANKVHRFVTENRSFVVAEVSNIGAVNDSEAKHLVAAFRTAYNRALRADQDYEAWLGTWRGKEADGCKPRQVGPEWKAFLADDESAGKAKQLFLDLYNVPAQKYGSLRGR